MSKPKLAKHSGTIVYVQYTNPQAYPPLENSARIFRSEGWKTIFLGIESEGQSNLLSFPPSTNLQVTLLSRWNSRTLLKCHYLCFLIWVWRRIYLLRPDLVYLSDPYSTPVGLLLAVTISARLIYHEHDSPACSNGAAARVIGWTRKQVAKRCFTNILPNAARANLFHAAIRSSAPTVVVMNCPSIEDLGQYREAKAEKKLVAHYHGSIGPHRVPKALMHALLQLPTEVSLFIAGYETNGSIGYIANLKAEADSMGLTDRVNFDAAIPFRSTLLARCASHHVGVALLPSSSKDVNELHMAGASNKIFDCLACGLPVLVPNSSEYHDLFVQRGVARACDPDDPSSIAKQLRWFLDHPTERFEMGERGRRLIREQWNYEKQFQPIIDALQLTKKQHYQCVAYGTQK